MKITRLAAILAASGLVAPAPAFATNGMLMEGYGPIAEAMGGASMAYDNGTAAMANNPATLGLMREGGRLDVMLGFVGPRVAAPGTVGTSKADAFYMPAIGYAAKQNRLAYGVGVYGQGGMGTEYPNGNLAQVSVGRIIFPLVYSVNDRLNLGGSLDLVWAGMDLVVNQLNIDFKGSSKYIGAAKGYSVAAKLGFTYRFTPALTFGGVYQTAGNLPDLKSGAYKVSGFDMPPIVGLGVAWQANRQLMATADLKDVLWGSSMNTVTIYRNGAVVAPFKQDWNNQLVVSLGAAYRFTDSLTGRIGYNYGKNPIPDQYVNYLWPATAQEHFTAGFGYVLAKNSDVNFALSYVPQVSVTGTGAPMAQGGNGGMTITHRQINWQLMYSRFF